MKKSRSRNDDDKVRQLCRDIQHEADREKLQGLVGRLQEALQEEQCGMRATGAVVAGHSDNPFDKIMV